MSEVNTVLDSMSTSNAPTSSSSSRTQPQLVPTAEEKIKQLEAALAAKEDELKKSRHINSKLSGEVNKKVSSIGAMAQRIKELEPAEGQEEHKGRENMDTILGIQRQEFRREMEKMQQEFAVFKRSMDPDVIMKEKQGQQTSEIDGARLGAVFCSCTTTVFITKLTGKGTWDSYIVSDLSTQHHTGGTTNRWRTFLRKRANVCLIHHSSCFHFGKL